jgi:hypothetical protein
MEHSTKKYRIVVTTPLGFGPIYGVVSKLTDVQYEEKLNLLKNSYDYNFMCFETPKGNVVIPGDTLKKSVIMLEKMD